MKRLVIAVIAVAACSGGSAVNPISDSGLDDVQSIEVEVVSGPGDEQRWLTITQPLAGEIAAELDDDLAMVAPRDCDPTFEIRLFPAAGQPVALAYGCDGQPLVWGEQAFWDGGMATAPQGFVELISVQISLLSQL